MELSKIAYDQEMAGKAKKYDVVRKKSQSLLYTYVSVLAEIDQLKQRGILADDSDDISESEKESWQNESGSEEGSTLSEADLMQLLRSVELLLGEFDFGKAEEVLKEMLEMSLDAELREKLADIRQRIADLDIETARSSLQKMRTNLT